ncbi:MAG: tetratricopeptide repeat protein [Candidatus Marinimicrobia bacterium]|nr:tetratricopeptide repeat protein [Candidatus Neomarinimicrobiota bacterium]
MLKARKKIKKKELKKDPFFEKIDESFRFYKQNQQVIIISLLVIILVILIGWYYFNSQNKKNEEAAGQFGIAQFYLSSQQYKNATKKFEEVNELFPGTKYSDLTLYYLGYINYNQNKFDEATKYFNDYLDKNCDANVINGAAYNGLAKIYEDNDNFLEAGINYKSAYKITPLEFKKIDYAFQSIECLIKAKEYEEANKLITKIANKHKLSDLENDRIKSFRMILELKNN